MSVRARWSVALVVVLASIALGGVAASVFAEQESGFPHETHQGLFPLCTGCHEGVPTGDRSRFYPDPATCRGCHNGSIEVTVSWNGPARRVGNVSFSHDAHIDALDAAGDAALQCASCHIPAGGGRMAVSNDIQLGTCFSCHAHEASSHQVDADCQTCHVPLARTAFDLAHIEAIPEPSDHLTATFVPRDHGRLARTDSNRCATCHTQERCASCHVDASLDAIAAIPSAPAGMELPDMVAGYPEPSTHLEGKWLTLHGGEASRQDCATCHTQNDCVSCHVQPVPAAVADMPSRDDVVAPGVGLAAHAPSNHESAFFLQAHTVLAASGDATCATCHQEAFCVSCHDGPVGGGYHPRDFLSRHTAQAFGRDAECSNCHNTQVFCRECHSQLGLTSVGRLGPGYHAAGTAWLLRHGQAARQNLESCASCHRQVDCTQCHGVLGAFKVSPHGVDFDAERAWARSPRTCLACHVDGNPLNE